MVFSRKASLTTNTIKKLAEHVLAPLILATSWIGLITGVIDATVKVDQFLSTRRVLTISILWIVVVLITWRGIPSTTRLLGLRGSTVRVLAITVATGLFAFVCVYPEIRTRWLDEGPARNPDLSPAGAILGGSAYAASATRFVIERIYVNSELSSFEERARPWNEFVISESSVLHSRVKDTIRSFTYNERVTAARESGRCISAEGDRPIVNVLPLLQERAERMNRQDLRSSVDNLDSYRRMMSRGADRFAQLLFTQIEIDRMRHTDPAAFKIVSRWLVDCVGVQNPVLTIEVRNLSVRPVLLTALDYAVDEAFIVLGGEAGPLTPAYTYDHVLPHARGVHRRQLVPPFFVNARSLGAFNVVVRPAEGGAGQAWMLRIHLRDSEGNKTSSERFLLIMSKLEP